jgi:2'-hydroxyisoflavone reductase
MMRYFFANPYFLRRNYPYRKHNMMKRRTLIKAITAASVTSALPFSTLGLAGNHEKLKVLFMGGTGFIGPHMVRALVAEGHDVTLFNRGKTNPHLFPDLKKIKGDRASPDIEQVSGQHWDLIVDSSCYIPRAVDMLMAAVDTSTVQQYIFISTISVYADFSQPGLHEGSELASMAEDPDSEEVGKWYGALKVRCEEQAEKAMPGKVTMVRCGLIIGPGDSTDRFTYWPERVAGGDEVLAPGTGDDYLQTIDVRDLADWVVHCINNKLVGPFNSTNPAGLYTIRDVLGLCRDNLNPDAILTWVPNEFLETQEVAPMRDLPLWVPPGTPFSGIWEANADLAASKGLKARPLVESIIDTHEWFQTLPAERQNPMKAGMTLERQAEVLAAWHASNSG